MPRVRTTPGGGRADSFEAAMIELVGWASHQHYKRRSAPWIKTYTKLLDDPTYRGLSHPARCLLGDLWLLATEGDNGRVQLASKALAWRLREGHEQTLSSLAELAGVKDERGSPRWVILHGDYGLDTLASKSLASCKQVAMPETETETETDTNVSGEPGELSTPTDEPLLPFGDLPPNLQREIECGLMGLVRTHLYCGRTPAGYDDARDVTILRQWLRRGRSRAEIADAIEGLAKARDRGDVHFLKRGERCTLRCLKNTKTGDLWTWDLAMKAAFDE